MNIYLLGTRGSCATANSNNMKYGGNTSCTLLCTKNHNLILDAGTGILNTIPHLFPNQTHFNILLSHYHMDHIAGLLLFPPLFRKETHIRIFAPEYKEQSALETLNRVFDAPIWPISLQDVQAFVEVITVQPHQMLSIHNFNIQIFPLNHPNGAVGYRISHDYKTIVYLFDHEEDNNPDSIVKYLKDVDLLLCDAPFTKETYCYARGFGHSTVESMIALSKKMNIKRTIVAHYMPNQTDEILDELQKKYSDVHYGMEGEIFSI